MSVGRHLIRAPGRAPRSSRSTLWTGLAVSLCVHAGVLWGLRWDAGAVPVAAMLDVVLVNVASDVAPAQPRLLAQAASVGGGHAGPTDAATTLPYTGPDGVPWLQEDLRQRQLQLEAAQHEVLRRLVDTVLDADAVPLPQELSLSWQHRSADGRDDTDQDAILESAHIAILAERVRAYDRQPRTHFFAPSTSPARYAQYVDDWRRVIEEVGTQHYPLQARGRLYGRLRMTVLLAADGSVRAIDIDQPSEHPLLNQAARRIVQLAAPFAPFPPGLAREVEQLSITRTWHFVNDSLRMDAPTP